MDKVSMLEGLISHYSAGNKARFAAMLGVKPQTINAWLTRNTFDAELIYAKCEGVSGDWLLSGRGEMLAGDRRGGTADGDARIVSLCRTLVRLYDEKAEVLGEMKELLK